MKIAVGADFHFEFYNENEAKKIINGWKFDDDTELIVIAGDLHVGADRVIETLQYIYETHGIHIVFVPGNHEYYHGTFEEVNQKFTDHGLIQDGYGIILAGGMVVDDVLFAGGMGNLDGTYEAINRGIHGALADFDYIGDFKDRVKRGRFEKYMLERALRNHTYREAVVVTHVMPHPKCIAPRYQGNYLNACFTNDWEDVIVEFKPKYWVCGHTHEIQDIRVDETDIIMNPHGYPREKKQWKWRYLDA